MFKRILVEEWQGILTVISFAIFGLVFLAMLIRVLRLPRQRVEQLAQLPLADDTEPTQRH